MFFSPDPKSGEVMLTNDTCFFLTALPFGGLFYEVTKNEPL